METTQHEHRLYRSRSHRMIAGVCGGLAEYFAIDVTVVRLLWALLTLFGGWGVIAYIVAIVIIPLKTETASAQDAAPSTTSPRQSTTPIWGILLLVVGVLWLAGHHGFHLFFPWWGLSWKVGIGVLLVVGGVMLLVNRGSFSYGSVTGASIPPDQGPGHPAGTRKERLMRSRRSNVIFGVCGGIGEYIGIDPVIVRLICVLVAFGSFGLAALMYLVAAAVLPLDDQVPRSATT